MIAKLIFILLVATGPFVAKEYIVRKNKKTLTDFFNHIGIQVLNTNVTSGIHFDRHVVKINKNLTFLEFKSLEHDIRNFTNEHCFLNKHNGTYMIDVNKRNVHRNMNSMLSQVNCYNVFSFMCERLLISVFYNIMVINLHLNFFIKTLKNYTTNAQVIENGSMDSILQELYKRSHPLQRRKTTEQDPFLFFIVNKPHSSLPFLLKYGKKFGIYVVMIGDQIMLNAYGNLVDYIFLTSKLGKHISTDLVNRNLPLQHTQDASDVILFNALTSQRIYMEGSYL
jgi:hypothetical protein